MKIDSIIKWAGATTTIVGTGVNNLGFFPLGPIILITSGLLWLVVSLMWKEMSMIVTNALVASIGIGTLLYHLYPDLFT